MAIDRRPDKYTPERVERIITAIRMGATQRLAAAYAGVDDDTVIRWRKRHAEFADAFKTAEGEASVGWLRKIEEAADGGAWQAAAWKLERRYPDEYGRHNVSVTGANGGPVNVNVNLDAAREQIAERLARIAIARSGAGHRTDGEDSSPDDGSGRSAVMGLENVG